MDLTRIISIGICHGLIHDLSFVGLYRYFVKDNIWDGKEMVLTHIISKCLALILINIIFKNNLKMSLIVAMVSIVIPNFIPGLMTLTDQKNLNVVIGVIISNIVYILEYMLLYNY